MEKIVSIRSLAAELDKTPVDMNRIGGSLRKRVARWIKRGDLIVTGGKLSLPNKKQ